MTILMNRPAAETTIESTVRTNRTTAAGTVRAKGSYTSRYDRISQPAPRPEGSYVSAESQLTRARGSYTCTDGAARRSRPEGSYTLLG